MRLLAAELLKLWTTRRTVLALLVALLAIVALGAAGISATADDGELSGNSTLLDVLSVVDIASVFAMVFGILIVTWELRHGTITQTFLASPRREWVLGAKAAAAALAGAFLVVVSAALALAITWVWVGGDAGAEFDAEVWERVGGQVLASALYGVLGVGVGAIVRGQALAVVLVFVWFLVVEPLIGVLWGAGAPYLPGTALDTLAGVRDVEDSLSSGAAAALASLYTAGFLAAGGFLTLRRDVT
ncbi:MAG: hypothetical protein ABR583_08225 [Gaiellaceae bacterium]